MQKRSSRLEPSLYPAEAVAQAVEAFRAAGSDVSFADGTLSVAAETDAEASALFDEVANYIAGLAAQTA